MRENLVHFADMAALVACAPFRSIVAPFRVTPGSKPPRVLGISFHEGEATDEALIATVEGARVAFAAGGSYLLLATTREVRDRLKAAILATHPTESGGGALQ